MTKERLREVWNALVKHGWEVANQAEMFELVNETIEWNLEHSWTGKKVLLVFYAFGHLGGPTQSLKDILYAKIPANDFQMYFHKIAKPEWSAAIDSLIGALKAQCDESDSPNESS